MPRLKILISDEAYGLLQDHITRTYGPRRHAVSLVIERAVREFLERQAVRRNIQDCQPFGSRVE